VPVWVIVVAAGRGERFGAPKQFALLRGRPVLQWSVDAARAVADGVVLVLPPGLGVDGAAGDQAYGADVAVEGGETRTASVRAGLRAVPGSASVIVVHDGARPLATPALFRSVVDAVVAGADAAVPALDVGDTLKRVDAGTVTATVARQGLVTVQTPQAFRAEVLHRAHASGADATDDAALAESTGATVRVVPGDPRNLKVTTVADLTMAEALAAP
jgi:2-C-methyl-D-erythritol 4-phosphate cytidylyltransferase